MKENHVSLKQILEGIRYTHTLTLKRAWKNGIDELICKSRNTDAENKHMDTKGKDGWDGSGDLHYV